MKTIELDSNVEVNFLLKNNEENDLFTNTWINENFEYLAKTTNKQDGDKDFILIVKKGLGKLEYIINKLNYEYEGQGKNIKVKKLILNTNVHNKMELKVIFERNLSIQEKIYNYLKGKTDDVLKPYKDKKEEVKKNNQKELEGIIKNNTKEKKDFN